MPPFFTGLPEPIAEVRWREIDLPGGDLLGVAGALRAEAYPWWLDSALPGERLGRFSFAGADPAAVARVHGRRLELHCRRAFRPGLRPGFRGSDDDPIAALRALLPRTRAPRLGPLSAVPFVGGAVGHLGYELAELTEPIALAARDDLGFPDATLLFVDRLIALDHVSGRAHAIGWGFSDSNAEAGARAEASLAACVEWLGRVPPRGRAPLPRASGEGALDGRRAILATSLPERARCSIERPEYERRVREVIEEIRDGNVYEANLSQRISIEAEVDAFALYRALRRESPAPFACFIDLPEGAILSSSPERFLRLAPDGRVESRPIKGTRPRGATPERDATLAEALRTSEKDRAENLMIVDLVRNDLGRVCEIGSVHVPELMCVEAYATVFHLVSTVAGCLRPDRDAFDLIGATFPPGSMTGAPKIAAMRIIDRLEPVRRGVYSGAVGYLDVRGGLDFSVVIRTLVLQKGRAHLHVGGAVVADSDPAAEHAETLDKARGMLAALASVDDG